MVIRKVKTSTQCFESQSALYSSPRHEDCLLPIVIQPYKVLAYMIHQVLVQANDFRKQASFQLLDMWFKAMKVMAFDNSLHWYVCMHR